MSDDLDEPIVFDSADRRDLDSPVSGHRSEIRVTSELKPAHEASSYHESTQNYHPREDETHESDKSQINN